MSTAIHRTLGLRALEASASPGTPLMEQAGRAAAYLAATLIAHRPGPVLVACGPGNNGGDGFVLARRLLTAGRDVVVLFDTDPATLPADAAAAHSAFIAAGGRCVRQWPQANWSLAVDALFGIGLKRAIDGQFAHWIEAFNQLPCPRLAIDIPSGLDADTGACLGPVIHATHTLTFIAMKPGLITLDGPDCCGQIHVDNLGLDAQIGATGWLNEPPQFSTRLAPRAQNTHKGCFGNAGIIGGAPGMVGAALLAGRAALKLGAGRVFVGCLDAAAPAVDTRQPELMLRSAQDVITLADALAIGPGLGQSDHALDLLHAAIERDVPLVLDADALNLLAAHPVLRTRVCRRPQPALLTPHPLEAARLLACEPALVQADRVHSAQQLARRFNANVMLKGCGGVIAQADGRWWINRTGNPGMASAGMGDVLTGLAVSLLAQGWPASEALRAATWLHGQAADDCVATGQGPIGLAASDTIAAARTALNRLVAGARQPS